MNWPQVYGGDIRDLGNRTTKLLQRSSGDFGTVEIPDYSEWTGRRVSAYRVTAACFSRADLFRDPPPEEGVTPMEKVRQTRKPNQHGLECLTELEESFKLA